VHPGKLARSVDPSSRASSRPRDRAGHARNVAFFGLTGAASSLPAFHAATPLMGIKGHDRSPRRTAASACAPAARCAARRFFNDASIAPESHRNLDQGAFRMADSCRSDYPRHNRGGQRSRRDPPRVCRQRRQLSQGCFAKTRSRARLERRAAGSRRGLLARAKANLGAFVHAQDGKFLRARDHRVRRKTSSRAGCGCARGGSSTSNRKWRG
jgi:hypothetical protein